MLYKRYVNVVAHFDKDGNVTPMAIIWDDGIEYEIDKVLRTVLQIHSEVGGIGQMFLCRIGGKERKLFYELAPVRRWFVESHQP